MDNYTATAASGPPPPDFNSNLTRSRSHNFAFTSSYSSLCQSRFAAIFAATFSWQSLLSDYQIVFCWASNNLPSCFDCNRKIGMSHSCFRRTADMQRDQDKRSSICLHVPARGLDVVCNGNAFNGWSEKPMTLTASRTF